MVTKNDDIVKPCKLSARFQESYLQELGSSLLGVIAKDSQVANSY